MTGTEQRTTAVGAHLVGGLAAPDAESAMRAAATALGRHLTAITDGETGARAGWIGWQLDKLTAIDGISAGGTKPMPAENPEYSVFPALSVDRSVTELPPRALGYADAVDESYPIYRRLCDEGAIPEGVRFQVSIPTPYATVVAYLAEADQEAFFDVYAAALAAEIEAIAELVDGDELTIQQDVAVEVAVLAGAFGAAGRLADREFVVESLRAALESSRGPGVECGVHLCYGDYKHRHFAVPQDLSLCVGLANDVADLGDFVHMPADRDTGRDPAYYEPLRELEPTRLALGVIDYDGDSERTRELVEAATEGSGGLEFAVATECGMARLADRPDSPSLERLLELHAEFARPIRG